MPFWGTSETPPAWGLLVDEPGLKLGFPVKLPATDSVNSLIPRPKDLAACKTVAV